VAHGEEAVVEVGVAEVVILEGELVIGMLLLVGVLEEEVLYCHLVQTPLRFLFQ
jgi:hypothetical protein